MMHHIISSWRRSRHGRGPILVIIIIIIIHRGAIVLIIIIIIIHHCAIVLIIIHHKRGPILVIIIIIIIHRVLILIHHKRIGTTRRASVFAVILIHKRVGTTRRATLTVFTVTVFLRVSAHGLPVGLSCGALVFMKASGPRKAAMERLIIIIFIRTIG